MRLALISDLHLTRTADPRVPSRRGELAQTLLLRTVHRLNRWLTPDLAIILGDVLNDPVDPNRDELLTDVRRTLDLLTCPYVILPGNHDPDPEVFYRFLPDPRPWMDVGGTRFVSFTDAEEPGYNARRGDEGLARPAAARTDWSGSIICLQHVPLFPPGASDCPYNYANADAVIDSMESSGVSLAISGHHHRGAGPIAWGHGNSVIAPALCESPFRFMVVDLARDPILQTHSHQMPESLRLWDTHTHTRLAYCNEDMSVAKSLALAEALGLEGVVVTEHAAHLYFNGPDYRAGRCYHEGITAALPAHNRFREYIGDLDEAGCPRSQRGIELDCALDGSLLVRPNDRCGFGFEIGAVHHMASVRAQRPGQDRMREEFLFQVKSLLEHGVRTLGHPFRVFRRARVPVPEGLFEATVGLLHQHGAAAEVNYHTNDPPPEFVRQCIERGVKLTLGSDAHNRYEVGELFPHLELLKSIGCGDDVRAVVLQM